MKISIQTNPAKKEKSNKSWRIFKRHPKKKRTETKVRYQKQKFDNDLNHAPRKPPKNPPATSLTPRTYPLHEVNELTRQTNSKWRRTSRKYKITMSCFSGKKEASKTRVVSSIIVRRSRVYRVRGSSGVAMAYLVNLWNVVWLFWLRIDVALWASIVASVGRKKDTCWERKIWILEAKKRAGLANFFLFQQKC